jgi:hypothetical protein
MGSKRAAASPPIMPELAAVTGDERRRYLAGYKRY